MRVVLYLFFISIYSTTYAADTLLFRSEFEKVGDVVGLVPLDGTDDYSLSSTNAELPFEINQSTGEITIKIEIDDIMGDVLQYDFSVTRGSITKQISVVDGYDYFIKNNPKYIELDEHLETKVFDDNYTMYNNIWGKGVAELGKDFRISTLYIPNKPDSMVIIWDTPSSASAFNGSSVWCYASVLWGARVGIREELAGFPIKIGDIDYLRLDFDFEKLYGDENYKIAMNMFLTDESEVSAFKENDGDFFLTFDQIGTWVPPYPVSVLDTIILGAPFELLYKDDDGYEYRRVIVTDHNKIMSGLLDINNLFRKFTAGGYIDPEQHIPNIQIGIEVSSGYGAVRFNKVEFLDEKPTSVYGFEISNKISVYPNPTKDFLMVELPSSQKVSVMNRLGVIQNVNLEQLEKSVRIDTSHLKKGVYYIIVGELATVIYKN